MTVKEIRTKVKKVLIAKGGTMLNADSIELTNRYGISCIDIQNALNYFKYSPQQKAFREAYNIH